VVPTHLQTPAQHPSLASPELEISNTMASTPSLCWACGFSDDNDQATCCVCSRPSSPPLRPQYIAEPSNTDMSYHMPTISASSLRKIWLRCGEDITPKWRQELKDIRAVTARRLRKVPSYDNLRVPQQGSVSVTLLQDNFIRQTPSITLTSTTDNPPTIDIDT
jgi:hypothetical protein